MKKTYLFLFVILLNILTMSAQSKKELLVLDNYVIPLDKSGAYIGEIITPLGEKVSIQKDASGLFEVNNSGFLSLKKGAILTEASPLSYELVVKYGEKEKAIELVKDEFIYNGVIAHRGAWKNQDASQNSMKSLKKAIELGCEGAEFDVWLSADNKAVLSHDPEIGGKKVEETLAEELFKIPLKDGDFLPSLEQYIECIKQQNKTRLVLEVKASQKGKERSQAVADSCVQIVHRMKAQAWVDYITFSFDAALRIRELDPTAPILYLEADKTLEELKAVGMTGIDYHYSHFVKDADLVNKSKEIGLLTNAWTVNKEEDMQELIEQGIDFITTDEPELLLELVAE